MASSVPLALYVHIPFCDYRCRYCNFTFETGWSPSLMARTLDGIVRDAEALRLQGEADGLAWQVRTLYLGGGTPGLVPAELLVPFLARLEAELGYRTSDLVEATLEANPENVTEANLAAWNQAGLNRLSLGVQTFDPDRLALLGRWCDGVTNRRALGLVADRWKGRWSADLMTGLPGQGALPPQRWVDLRADLEELLAYEPGHVSLYSLTVEPGTDLEQLRAGGGVRVATDPVADQLWLRARQTLIDRGFDWYEISNFARPDHWSRHNQAYWRLEPWAGLGPGAHGTVPTRDASGRLVPLRTIHPRLFPWLAGDRDRQILAAPEFALEHFLTGWRTSEGVSRARWQRLFGPWPAGLEDVLSDPNRLLLDTQWRRLPDFSDLRWQSDWPEKS